MSGTAEAFSRVESDVLPIPELPLFPACDFRY